MEVERSNTRGIAGAGLGLGIAGTALGVLNGGLGNILGNGCGAGWNGGWNGGCAPVGVCSESQLVNRYEAGQAARIAELETEVKLRDANFYTISEMGKLRDYVDGKFAKVEGELCNQRVVNAQIIGNTTCMAGQIQQLYGLTKLVVPNAAICPGWGDVTVAITPTTTPTTAG